MPTESHPGLYALTKYWDIPTLRWVKGTQPSGGGGGGGAVTVADGADITQGAIADAAVITDTTGTLSGKLRGLVKWAFERMPASLGQKTMAASLPVALASDQAAIPVTLGSGTSATGTLGALNAEVVLAMAGRVGAGFSLIDSSFVGVITVLQSFDGGTVYTETNAYRPFSASTFSRLFRLTNPGSLDGIIDVGGGATHVKLKVTTYTSGSMAAAVSATNTSPTFVPNVAAHGDTVQGIALVGGRYASVTGPLYALWLTDQQPATNAMGLAVREVQATAAVAGGVPGELRVIGAKDITDNTVRAVESKLSAPVAGDRGLITRNIPTVAGAGAVTALTQRMILASDDPAVASLALIKAKTDNIDVALSTRLKPADTLAGVTTVTTVTTVGAVTSITNPVSTKTGLTGAAPAANSVGLTTAAAVAANASRKGLVLVNTSVNRISLGIGQAAVLDSGITLYPQGVFEMDEYTFSTAVINAIASGAASNLAIQELT